MGQLDDHLSVDLLFIMGVWLYSVLGMEDSTVWGAGWSFAPATLSHVRDRKETSERSSVLLSMDAILTSTVCLQMCAGCPSTAEVRPLFCYHFPGARDFCSRSLSLCWLDTDFTACSPVTAEPQFVGKLLHFETLRNLSHCVCFKNRAISRTFVLLSKTNLTYCIFST